MYAQRIKYSNVGSRFVARLLSFLRSLFFLLILGSFAQANAGYVLNTGAAPSPLTGLWWNPNESGWGLSLTQQGPVVFMAWYTYGQSGAPDWYVMSNCAVAGNACTGDIYGVTGGSAPGATWNGAGKIVSKAGSGTLSFSDDNSGVFSYNVNGASGVKNISRQMFGSGSTPPANDYSGLWWNSAESGWGIALAQQYGTIFATWFTYDSSGKAIWYTASNCVVNSAGNGCAGDLFQVIGGTPPTATWNGTNTLVGKVGSINVGFNGTGSSASATMSFTLNGASGSKSITPQQFYSFPNAFTPRFVSIPGGTYVMGDHFNFVDPDHPSDEVPLHNVTISPFNMSTTLVTNKEYADYLNAALKSGLIEVRSGIVYAVGGTNVFFYTSSSVPLSPISWSNNSFGVRGGRELHPVTGVRWFGAAAFTNWLSQRDGYTPCYDLSSGACDLTRNSYRLPTEAEWEYAARGGQYSPYRQFPWGDDTNADGRLANWEKSGDPWDSGDYPRTTPVGFYNGSLRNKADYGWPAADVTYQTRDATNAYGLTDMAGNVWEWVNDWYANAYYQYCVTNNISANPPGPASGDIMQGNIPWRAMRGGTWWNGGGQQFLGFSRVSNRDPSWSLGGSPDSNPDSAWLQVGFRVMRPDRAASSTSNTIGLMQNTSKAFAGYTLMSPIHSTATYLLDNAGNYVHKWTSTGEPGRSSYLLENGHMIRASAMQNVGPSTGGGEGGRIEEYDWNGTLVWGFNYYGASYIAHHDFKVLPNGNVLILASEKKTYAEAIAAGFNPNLFDPSIASQGYMLPDYLVEVKPTGATTGTVVWEWHIWDHLIQDFDAGKGNYGVVANHPELVDVNGPTGARIQQFWNHANGIDYNAQLDQIMISIRGNSELMVIDHGATTAQSSSHAGGRYNKGGDILYRWGYAQQYDRGTAAERKLFQQHHTHWIEPGLPGAGNILIYNNGIGRGYSTVDEIVPPLNAAGSYTIAAGAAFGPSTPTWTYIGTPPTSFYSAEISGAQRLPNGNTLITEGVKGNLFEVTSAGEMVWRYINPVTTTPLAQGSTVPADPNRTDQFMNAVFRVTRYGADYPGLQGKVLTPIGTIETY